MTGATCAARHEHRRPPSTAHRQQPLQAASQDFALLRYARTHSGFVPTAAIAVRSCVVEHRKIAVQYLTSRPSLILTRARSIRLKSPRSIPFSDNQAERSPLDVGRVRPMTVLPGNATICAFDHELGPLALCEISPPPDRLTFAVMQRVGTLSRIRLNCPTSVGTRLHCDLRLSRHAFLRSRFLDVKPATGSRPASPFRIGCRPISQPRQRTEIGCAYSWRRSRLSRELVAGRTGAQSQEPAGAFAGPQQVKRGPLERLGFPAVQQFDVR